MKSGQIDAATDAKCHLEQRQREEARLRREAKQRWEPVHFQDQAYNWVYRWPLVHRIAQLNGSSRDDSSFHHQPQQQSSRMRRPSAVSISSIVPKSSGSTGISNNASAAELRPIVLQSRLDSETHIESDHYDSGKQETLDSDGKTPTYSNISSTGFSPFAILSPEVNSELPQTSSCPYNTNTLNGKSDKAPQSSLSSIEKPDMQAIEEVQAARVEYPRSASSNYLAAPLLNIETNATTLANPVRQPSEMISQTPFYGFPE
ncbi:unnamed protein product [Protopolystoma xenopodis]|uniref:Uncharacterized protein n=1 Tax=Protopolystoma xenopodis TaxID=117903 RepID=A0A448WYS6_9PLAT|nr:unnamed protein product [Protopolystoma xenopodis]